MLALNTRPFVPATFPLPFFCLSNLSLIPNYLKYCRSGSHVIFLMYDSSNENTVLYAEQLVRNWTTPPPLLILIDNRPPSGDGKFEPRIKSAEHIIISTAKKGNIVAPLQLAARKLLNDSLFSFDLKQKPSQDTILSSIVTGDLPAPSSTPNPATIAAAAAATSSSSTRATPASWNAKKSSSVLKVDPRESSAAPPQPLSRTCWHTLQNFVGAFVVWSFSRFFPFSPVFSFSPNAALFTLFCPVFVCFWGF